MTELKTLKEMEDKHVHEIEECCREELAAELRLQAISELFILLTDMKTPIDIVWEKSTGMKIVYSEEGKQAVINYIKWKFNLTEADLK